MDFSGVVGCFGEDLKEEGLGDVVGAGASDEVAAGPKKFQGAQIDLFVAALGGGDAVAIFGEGGRVEDDHVESAADFVVLLQQIEGVALAEDDV